MLHNALLIDAGTGNLRSVYHAIVSMGFSVEVTSNPEAIKPGEKIILPGVGAFGKFMEGLHQRNLVESLKEAFYRGDFFLGICVGMQALFDEGEEGNEFASNARGLGLIPGRVPRFKPQPGLKIPHTGWNQLSICQPSPLLKDIKNGPYAYFNHSYYCSPSQPGCTITSTDYGQPFASIVQQGSLYGVQFHPEKSQRVGLKILENFMYLK